MLLSWQAHEAGLRRRRAVGPHDIVDHLRVVGDELVRAFLARLVVVLLGDTPSARVVRLGQLHAELRVETLPAEVLRVLRHLRQDGAHRQPRGHVHVRLAALVAGYVGHVFRRGLEARAEVLGGRNPRRGLRHRREPDALGTPRPEQPLSHLEHARVDLDVLSRQGHNLRLARRRAGPSGDVA